MSGIIYNSCRNYVDTVDTALTVADWTVVKPLTWSYQLTEGFAKTIAFAYKEGVEGCAREAVRGAKWLTGIHNFEEGMDALKIQHKQVRTIVTTANPNESKEILSNEVTQELDERSFATRVGQMGGHFTLGTSKIAYSTAYTVGTISNALGQQAEGTIHKTTQVVSEITNATAKTAFETAKIAIPLAKEYVKGLVETGIQGAYTLTTDSTVFNVTAAATGTLGGIYVASKGFMGVANAENWKGKVTYGAMMISGFVLSAASIGLGVTAGMNHFSDHANVKGVPQIQQ